MPNLIFAAFTMPFLGAGLYPSLYWKEWCKIRFRRSALTELRWSGQHLQNDCYEVEVVIGANLGLPGLLMSAFA